MADVKTLLIGAGPAALAALDGLRSRDGIGVVTGAVQGRAPSGKLHAKIRAVATDRGEPVGLDEALFSKDADAKLLFATAAIGGLACYWGQQFVRQTHGDPWSREIFRNFDTYERECAALERLFVITGDEKVDSSLARKADLTARLPRLVIGTPQNRQAGLGAMAAAFSRQLEEAGATRFDTRVKALAETRDGWRVDLDDGGVVVAQRVLLAAGVVGTAKILMRSFRDIKNARFRDHVPWMSYMLGFRTLVAARPKGALRHLNAVTLTKEEDGSCTVFSSVYDMRQAGMNLLTASTIGRSFSIFRGWRAPPGAGIIQPTQIWTKETAATIELDAHGWVSQPRTTGPDPSKDNGLTEFTAALSRIGVRALKTSRTPAGFGFHYHALELRSGAARYVPVDNFLRERTGAGVTCVDASILPNVGQRPHTLTAMAAARRLVRDLDGIG